MIGPFIIAGAIAISSMRIVNEYERGVKFTLGKYAGIMKPGLRIVLPLIQSWQKVDMRVIAADVPDQDCITKDNVSVRVNAVLDCKVQDSSKNMLQVQYYG